MHVSDSTIRWCGGLCLPLHDLQCAFYLHVVSLGRKLCTHLWHVFVTFCKMKAYNNYQWLHDYYVRLDNCLAGNRSDYTVS